MIAEMYPKLSDEQEHKVEQSVETITNLVDSVQDHTRNSLFKAIGVFDQNGMPTFYSILLTSDSVDFDVADEVFESMGDGILRTEVLRRLRNNGLFNIRKNA